MAARTTFHPEDLGKIARTCAAVRIDGRPRTITVRAHTSFNVKWGTTYVYKALHAVFGQLDGPGFVDDWRRITVTLSRP